MKATFFMLLLGILPIASADQESWPQFRGPGGFGKSESRKIPTELNKDTLAWSVSLPGDGSSSPIIWGSRLFITSVDKEDESVTLVCLDAITGESKWTRSAKGGSPRMHRMNNPAAPTPVATKDVVVLSWYDEARRKSILSGYSHEGAPTWEVEVGPHNSSHGPALQPSVHENRILFANLHKSGGTVGALDAETGKMVWSREYDQPASKNTYAAPFVRERLSDEGPRKEVVVASTGTGVIGLDFETGKDLWEMPGVFNHRCIISPFDLLSGSGLDDALIVAGCKNNTFFALRPPDAAAGKDPEIAWRLTKAAPYVPTPVSDGKTTFVLSDGGIIHALDSKSGEPRWVERLQGNFYASPILANGKLYCLTREGEMIVAEVGESFNLIASSSLKPADHIPFTDATPAIAHDSLYVRVGDRLDCYRQGR